MFKKVLSFLLVLCMLVSFAACSDEVDRPDDWDEKAEFLEFLNGYYSADSAEKLTPYVVADTPDSQKEAVLSLKASAKETAGDMPYITDYVFDSVEMTLLETYEGYEIFWVTARSSAYEKAMRNFNSMDLTISDSYLGLGVAAAPTMAIQQIFALTIEDDRYVVSLDEDFQKEIQAKYTWCQNCLGHGYVYSQGSALCPQCTGMQEGEFSRKCSACGTEAVEVITEPGDTSANDDDVIISAESAFVCPNCGGKEFVVTITPAPPCDVCQNTGLIDTKQDCPDCAGKGYIKH